MSDKHFEDFQPTTTTQKVNRIILGVVIILIAGGASYYWKNNKVSAKKKNIISKPPLVQTTKAVEIDHPTSMFAMGTIMAKQQTLLTPQVSGKVTSVHPNLVPGKIIKKDDATITIDPRDYKNILDQRMGELARVESELKLEVGRQKSAQKSFELLNEKVSSEEKSLILREPQMKSVRARLKAANAAVAKAKLDLERTKVLAPFNAIVQTKEVSVGVNVTQNSRVATLVDTQEYWIEVAIPQDKLSLISLNQTGKTISAKVYINKTQFRVGTVISIKPQVINNGRMAQAIVQVKDPLGLLLENKDKGKLLLGNFSRIEIKGNTLNKVISLPYKYVHDGSKVWILRKNNTLEMRKVQLLFSEKEKVFVSSSEINPGERIITSYLPTPINHMALRTGKQKP